MVAAIVVIAVIVESQSVQAIIRLTPAPSPVEQQLISQEDPAES
jgi:hypothetical protein